MNRTILSLAAVSSASSLLLVDSAGKYVGFFPPGTSADRMVEMIQPELAALTASH